MTWQVCLRIWYEYDLKNTNVEFEGTIYVRAEHVSKDFKYHKI
jgi:hypothetical protein